MIRGRQRESLTHIRGEGDMKREVEIGVMIEYSQPVQFIRKACSREKGMYILNNIFANLKRLGI